MGKTRTMNSEQRAIRDAFLAGFRQEQDGGGAYYASRLTSFYLKGRLIARELGLYPGALSEYDEPVDLTKPVKLECGLVACADPEHRAVKPEPVSCKGPDYRTAFHPGSIFPCTDPECTDPHEWGESADTPRGQRVDNPSVKLEDDLIVPDYGHASDPDYVCMRPSIRSES